MGETARKRAARPAGEPDAGATHEDAPACPVAWCPVCMAVTAVQPLHPEVMEHLLKAGTELLMAVRAVLDVRADGLAGGAEPEGTKATRLEKIELG